MSGTTLRRTMLLTALAVTITSIGAQTGQTDRRFTDNIPNGRAWIQMSQDQRSFFVAGIRAAIVQVHNEQTLMMEPGARMNTEELCDSLSRIYSDPVNLAIPVTAAMMVVKLRVTGTSPAKVEAVLADLRKTAAEHQ